MTKDKPCCDNCPHYAVEEKNGLCLYDAPCLTYDDAGVPKHAIFIVEKTHRCSNHPWIARHADDFWNSTTSVVNMAEDWRAYIDELPFILDILAGGGDKAVRKEDDHA